MSSDERGRATSLCLLDDECPRQTDAEPAISLVIFVFCAMAVSQNTKITKEIPVGLGIPRNISVERNKELAQKYEKNTGEMSEKPGVSCDVFAFPIKVPARNAKVNRVKLPDSAYERY